jgi:hypothetical protein
VSESVFFSQWELIQQGTKRDVHQGNILGRVQTILLKSDRNGSFGVW